MTSHGSSSSTVVVRDSGIELSVDPSRGAKITSVRNLASGREWLLQDPALPAALLAYGDVFTDSGMSGWDEMFPTVDACGYLGEAVDLPDHGEVWSRPWRVLESTSTSIVTEIDGCRLDYRLRRRIDVAGSRVTCQYRLTTSRPQGLAALWAPHPQFAASVGTVLELPSVDRVDTQLEGSSGPFRSLDVPAGGLDVHTLVPKGEGMMLYAGPEVRVDRAVLVDPDGNWIEMAWDSRTIPYFAVWMDNGRYAPSAVVCPEPMSGYFDALLRAQEAGRVLSVRPGVPVEWTLEVTVGQRSRA
jgi:galactose mutarotase-like enzyme